MNKEKRSTEREMRNFYFLVDTESRGRMGRRGKSNEINTKSKKSRKLRRKVGRERV
jgi:hypothetical protein